MFSKPIIKIAQTLENTKLGYCDGKLKECEGYCATGVLLVESGIYVNELEECYGLADFSEYDNIVEKMKQKYGIDFNRCYYTPIRCPLCYSCDHKSVNLEHVLTHINDEHNSEETHKETARQLLIMSQLYNLETGERLFAKKKV
jgi:hypothetical protein